jgi:hypothetical protein
MPDLNQRNPHLANYLVQQALWWVEYAGIDAFRIDTYTYSDQEFMSRFCREIRAEYPSIHLFGEVWEYGVIPQGFFADNQPMARAKFDSKPAGRGGLPTDLRYSGSAHQGAGVDGRCRADLLHPRAGLFLRRPDAQRDHAGQPRHDPLFFRRRRKHEQVQKRHRVFAHHARHPAIVLRHGNFGHGF